MLRRSLRFAANIGPSATVASVASAAAAAPATSPPSPGPGAKLSSPIVSQATRLRSRAFFVPNGDSKAGKRQWIKEALDKDREIAQTRKKTPLWMSLIGFPWKWFLAWMFIWTWMGYSVIPRFKRWQSQEAGLPEHIREEMRRDPPPLTKIFTEGSQQARERAQKRKEEAAAVALAERAAERASLEQAKAAAVAPGYSSSAAVVPQSSDGAQKLPPLRDLGVWKFW